MRTRPRRFPPLIGDALRTLYRDAAADLPETLVVPAARTIRERKRVALAA